MISVIALFEKTVGGNDPFAPGAKYVPVGGKGYPDPGISGHTSPQEQQRQDNEAELQAAEIRKQTVREQRQKKNPAAIAALQRAKMQRGEV